MRYTSFLILAARLCWPRPALAIVTSDQEGSHAIVPGEITVRPEPRRGRFV